MSLEMKLKQRQEKERVLRSSESLVLESHCPPNCPVFYLPKLSCSTLPFG